MGLTLFSELHCQGKSVVLKDKEVNLCKAGLTFPAKVSQSSASPQSSCYFSRLKLLATLGSCTRRRDFRNFFVF